MLHAAAAQGRELDAFVVRKAEKAHGMQRRIEGPDVERPARARRRRHLHHGRFGADRGRGAARGRAPRWSASPSSSTATPGPSERVAEAGLDYRWAFDAEDLGL